MSLIQTHCLPTMIEIDDSVKLKYAGIQDAGPEKTTLGFVWIPLLFGTVEKELRLHVVDKRDIDLDHDGLLGNPFCSKRVIIDCCNETIRIPLYNFETSFYQRTIVPAHSRKILTLKVCQESPKIGLVKFSNLPRGLQALEGIVEKSSKQEIFLPVTNQTSRAIAACPLQVSLVPVKKLLLIQVIRNITNDRKSLLKTALCLEHLPNFEREDLLKLLWEYNDLVFLPGDSLERSVVKAEFKINTRRTTPAHAKLCRFPNIHKTEFCSQLMDELHKALDIRQVLCAPYHPQSNGQLEKAHGVLKDYLSFYCSVEKPDSWDLYLRLASSACNKSVHSSTKHSPHELIFGRPPNLPINDEDTSTLAFKQDRLLYLQDIALQNVDETKKATKARFDKKT